MVTPLPRETSPVLLFGSGITVLGAMRSLARVGIVSYAISPKPDIEAASRWYKRLPHTRHPGEEESISQFLQELPLEKAVLMPCSDHWTRQIGSVQLDGDRFRLSQSTPDVQEILIDKGKFAAALTRYCIPHPRTVLLEQEEDLLKISENDISKFILKPRDSQSFFRRFHVKAFKLSSQEQALMSFREIRAAGYKVMLQEYIAGDASQHYYVEGFICRHGKFRAIFARQRLRMHPADFGNSTAMVSVFKEEATGAIQALQRLLSAIGYRGIFSAEFKLDHADGQFKLIEINARPWWYVEFATHCGVNTPHLAYLDALELEVPVIDSYRIGLKSINLYTDWQVTKRLLRQRDLSILGYGKDLLLEHHTVFSWRDPLPSVGWLFDKIRGVVQSFAERYFGSVSDSATPLEG